MNSVRESVREDTFLLSVYITVNNVDGRRVVFLFLGSSDRLQLHYFLMVLFSSVIGAVIKSVSVLRFSEASRVP